MENCLAVGFGGFVGSILRYLIGLVPLGGGNFPAKTFFINVAGAFLIGFVTATALKNPTLMDRRLVLFLKVGVCGGFTTFSTYALEIGGLIENNLWGTAVLYIVVSTILGTLAYFCGCAVVR